jgi:hypothetical protein
MPSKKEGKGGAEGGSREPFISGEDRPEVKISLDTPLSELRVRELATILGYMTSKSPHFEVGKTSIKDFFDKDFPEVAKDWLKEIKVEIEKKPEKYEKLEKLEKREIKELKSEKMEIWEEYDLGIFRHHGGIDQLVQTVAGLARQVSQLANQVEELQGRVGK